MAWIDTKTEGEERGIDFRLDPQPVRCDHYDLKRHSGIPGHKSIIRMAPSENTRVQYHGIVRFSPIRNVETSAVVRIEVENERAKTIIPGNPMMEICSTKAASIPKESMLPPHNAYLFQRHARRNERSRDPQNAIMK